MCSNFGVEWYGLFQSQGSPCRPYPFLQDCLEPLEVISHNNYIFLCPTRTDFPSRLLGFSSLIWISLSVIILHHGRRCRYPLGYHLDSSPHLSWLADSFLDRWNLDLSYAICSMHGLPKRHSRSVSEGGPSTDHPRRKHCRPEATLQLDYFCPRF